MELEKRVFELRKADKESRKIGGYAAMYDKESENLGWFVERIAPGAFKESDMSDVRALVNHNDDLILARSSAGTLELKEDETGLYFEFEAPNTTAGNDCLENIRNGNYSQCSFAFTVKNAKWENETRDGKNVDIRIIEEIEKVYDVSVVTYPAYPDTTVAVRSREAIKEAETKPKTDRELQARRKRVVDIF